MRFRHLFFLLGLGALAHATTVQPPTFAQLVDEADGIYRGRVTAVEARRVLSPEGASVIKTCVTFAVDRVVKGAARPSVLLEFLGGTIGDESLDVSGTPRFHVGQREILFVQKNGEQFCPLVRLGHGRYRIEQDAAGQSDYITRDNHAPLAAVEEVGRPLEHGPEASPARAASARAPAALTPDAFEARIRGELQRTASGAPRP